MSDIPPRFGFGLAGQQPTPVPLFSSFDWASDSEPEGDPRDVFALQFCGKVPSETFASDLDMAAMFAPTAPALKGAFEELFLRFVGAAATQAPDPRSSPPIRTTIGSSKARYHLLSTHAVGGFLAIARFWIPPMSSADAEGTWSDPVPPPYWSHGNPGIHPLQYNHLLSTQAVSGFLEVAHFWILPMSSADAESL